MIKYTLLNVERGAFQLARIPERSKGTDLRSVAYASWVRIPLRAPTRLAQLVERTPFKRVVEGSSPSSGVKRGNLFYDIII